MTNTSMTMKPCGHSLDIKILGDKCPICHIGTTQCNFNNILSQASEQNAALPEVKAEESVVVPFPGKGAKFEVTRKWKQLVSPGQLCANMELESDTPHSF